MLILLVVVILSLLINGCAGNNSGPAASSDNQSDKITGSSADGQKNTGTLAPGAAGKKANETMKITVYHASQDALHLVPEVHTVQKQTANPQTALELLLTGTASKDLIAVMPQGTKLHGVTIKNHIAYADFTDALIKNHGGGSQTELLLVGAIVNTLTEFPDIQKVQILVDGKKLDTISGHLDISEPVSRFERLIKKST
jgi:spore germination protein GerM